MILGAEEPQHLMNPATGSVDTIENWEAERDDWETVAGQTPAQQFAALVPVVQDADGDWVELKESEPVLMRDAAFETLVRGGGVVVDRKFNA